MRFEAVLLAALLTTLGCSERSNGPRPETTNVPECDSYVAAYHACLTQLGPGADSAIDKRVAMTRASFTANARDPAGRAHVAQLCASGLTRLKSACP